MGRLGLVLGVSGPVWGRLASVLELSWAFLGRGSCLETVSGVSLKRVLAVSSLSGPCLGLSQAVLQATRRFWTTVSRFQAILVITLGAKTRFWTTVARFQAILGAVLGHRNKGPPPQGTVLGSLGEIKRGNTEGIPKKPHSLNAPQGGAGGLF